MSLVNLLNILAFYITLPLLKGSLSVFVSVIGVSLVSRMVLNLREVSTLGIPLHQFSRPSAPEAVLYLDSSNFQLRSIDADGPANCSSPTLSYGWQQATIDDHLPIIEITRIPRPIHKLLAA
ncbi:hypothetical protein FIBSPDRAFT_1042480 [Athelia psychrophila]|uniref:Uncharacterized protein n=1 Tax=Athelia psychrophila TaxID=1759441 RepID=A0A166MEA4_9AGAM|nr:hypothetical protein FIBSPDRAFT_1042480 [Fibularhizoctonia sp. CBS 109695]